MQIKNKLKFKNVVILYSCVLGILMVAFLIHVFDSLVKYEKNQTEKYIENTLQNICHNGTCDINNLSASHKSPFDKDESLEVALENLLKTADLKIEETLDSKEDEPTYEIKANDQLVLEVKLKSSKKINRLGLLSFYIWENAEVTSKIEQGFYTYNITVPNNYKVYLNDKELTTEQIKDGTQAEGFLEITKYVSIPYEVKYEVSNLYLEPNIKILDEENKEIQYEKHGQTIVQNIKFNTIESLEEASQKIENIPEILKIAEEWSLFLTDDLKGKLHGFYDINNYLIEDSTLSKFAKSWATGIDITFTSKHTFDNPMFSNEEVKNFEIYSSEAFSCEVYLEKNMIIKGNKHKDVMHDRLYFVKINNGWKLVNMQAITEGNNNERSSNNNSGV